MVATEAVVQRLVVYISMAVRRWDEHAGRAAPLPRTDEAPAEEQDTSSDSEASGAEEGAIVPWQEKVAEDGSIAVCSSNITSTGPWDVLLSCAWGEHATNPRESSEHADRRARRPQGPA